MKSDISFHNYIRSTLSETLKLIQPVYKLKVALGSYTHNQLMGRNFTAGKY